MSADDPELRRLLLYAYPDRVTVRRPGDPCRGVMVGGRGVVLEPGCRVRRGPLFLALDARDLDRTARRDDEAAELRVSLASAIEPDWLGEVHPHLIERRVRHRVDPDRETVESVRETRFAGLLVRADPAPPRDDPDGVAAALADYLARAPEALLARDEKAEALLARVRFLARTMPELGLPQFDAAELTEVLVEAARGCRTVAQVLKRGLAPAIDARLEWRAREALKREAPETIRVPSGSRIRLRYPPDGPPVLAVRLQELFGQAETPRVAAGRVSVVIELLGPNFRPVQVTTDLAGFWRTTYAEVRRELRARYPRHPWPEDPWSAEPRAVGRHRG